MRQRRSIRLFCIPYAGASAAAYLRWQRRLPAWIEVVPVELPGRGRRFSEAPETTLAGMLGKLRGAIALEAGTEFAFFGHSLGALLAFELAYELEQGGLEPLVVFASGAHAPSRRGEERTVPRTDAELRAELVRLDGTPPEVLAEPELMQLVLPVLRADFELASEYECAAGRRILAPIHVLGGVRDSTTFDLLNAWRDHTSGDFSMNLLPGGHFFIHEHEAELLALLEARLSALDWARAARSPHEQHGQGAVA